MKWTAIFFGLGLAVAVALGWTSFGQRAAGQRRARMAASPEWRENHFVNPQPLVNDNWETLRGVFRSNPYTSPATALPVVTGGAERFRTPPVTGLRVTWFG